MSDPPPQVVVLDATVLINLLHADLVRVVASLPGYTFVVPAEVVGEVVRPAQVAALRGFTDAGLLRCQADLNTSLKLYAELRQMMGKGEAACLTLAYERGWIVACDEGRAFRREATQRLGSGRLVTTPGLIVLAIRAGLMTVEQADHAKTLLEGNRFKMTFASFRDLVTGATAETRKEG